MLPGSPGPHVHDDFRRALMSSAALIQIASHAAREVPGVDHLAGAPHSTGDAVTQVESVTGDATTVSIQIVVRTAVGLLEAATGVRDNVRAALSHMAGLAAGDVIVDVHVVDIVQLDPDTDPGAGHSWAVTDWMTSALTGLVDDAAGALATRGRLGAEAVVDVTATPTCWSPSSSGAGRARVTRTGSHRLGLIWPQVPQPIEGNP